MTNTIKLRPKVDPRPIRFGAPWVFADQLVLDRRSRAIAAGSVVDLMDNDGRFLAQGAFNANSKIAFRVLDRNQEANIGADWIFDRIEQALRIREQIYPTPFYRLVHAEGDLLPGVVVDRFGDHAVIQPNAAWADLQIEAFGDALERWGMPHILMNGAGRTRKLEGLDETSRVLRGAPKDVVEVEMNGVSYFADLASGQKTGLFYDQRENHAFAAKLAKGDVLDVFCHVGGFGLAMLGAGAEQACFIDSSKPALEWVQKSATHLQKSDAIECLQGDAFAKMQELVESGRQFDVVICDPPAFAPAKPALEAGLRAYERVARLAAQLVKRGGYLGLCSCSHAATAEKFTASSLRGIGKAGRSGRILHRGAAGADHPQHPYLSESGYLKSIFLALD